MIYSEDLASSASENEKLHLVWVHRTDNPGGVTASRLRCMLRMTLAIAWITLGTVDGFNVFMDPWPMSVVE